MPYVRSSVARRFRTQVLSTSYGAGIEIPVGAIDATITLSDATIAFVVQDQAGVQPEEGVGAGASWALGNSQALGEAVTVKVKAASSTPTAVIAWFQLVA